MQNLWQNKHFTYWVFPFSIILSIILGYSFGPYLIQEIISPSINREFGLLETLQALMLLASAWICIRAIRLAEGGFQKFVFTLLASMAVFVFLEEIDYGINYYDYFKHITPDYETEVRNVHNQGDVTYDARTILYPCIFLFFVVAPYFLRYFPAILRPYIPSKMMIFTVGCMVILPNIAYYINYTLGYTGNMSLYNNVSEYDETVLYYILLLYCIEIRRNVTTTFPA